MPRKVPLGTVIASRQFVVRGRPGRKAEVRIGAPKNSSSYAYCPVQLVGLGDGKVRPIYGVDTLQALQLVFLRYIGPLLLRFGDKLRWEGQAAHKSLQTDPWALFEEAGLSEFLSDFAALCAEYAARVRPLRGRRKPRDSRSK